MPADTTQVCNILPLLTGWWGVFVLLALSRNRDEYIFDAKTQF